MVRHSPPATRVRPAVQCSAALRQRVESGRDARGVSSGVDSFGFQIGSPLRGHVRAVACSTRPQWSHPRPFRLWSRLPQRPSLHPQLRLSLPSPTSLLCCRVSVRPSRAAAEAVPLAASLPCSAQLRLRVRLPQMPSPGSPSALDSHQLASGSPRARHRRRSRQERRRVYRC